MIAACLESLAVATSMTVWISKDASGSLLWTERPHFDLDTKLFHHDSAETVAVPSAFTAAWPAPALSRLVVRQPGLLP